MKKIFSLMLTLTLVLGLLAGCGGSGDSGAAADAGTAEAPDNADADTGDDDGEEAAPVSSGDNGDLLLWMPPFASGDDDTTLDKEFWEGALLPWAADNGVNLTIEITPWGNYEEKYLTAFSSGTGPDIGYMYNEMFYDFIEMGVLSTVDSYFTQEEIDNYVYWDLGQILGEQYTVPFVVGNARVMFFNMDILEQAGVTEVPETWDDLIDVMKQVDDADIDGVIAPMLMEWADPAIGGLNNAYYPYLWQAGGELYNDAGELTLGDGDAAVTAAQYVYDLMYVHEVVGSDSLSMSEGDVRAAFLEGKMAAAVMAANRAALIEDAGITWDFVGSLKGSTQGTFVAADALVLNNASENKEMAAELIKHITSAEVMEQFHKEISSFPPITRDAEYLDNERLRDMYENADYLKTLPVAPNTFKMMDTLYKNLQLMMLGDLTAEEAIQNTVDYVDSLV